MFTMKVLEKRVILNPDGTQYTLSGHFLSEDLGKREWQDFDDVLKSKTSCWSDEYDEETEKKTHFGNWAYVTCNAAIEIDNYILGKRTDFYSTNLLTELLRRNMIPGKDIDGVMLDLSPNISNLIYAISKDSDKKLVEYDDFTLEMRLLYSELTHLESLPKERLENLRKFCVELSGQYLADKSNDYCSRLVA